MGEWYYQQKGNTMPNWCYNSLTITGDSDTIAKVKARLNTPFTMLHDNWDPETREMSVKEFTYSKPVFAFYNIVNHREQGISDEVYNAQPPQKANIFDDSGSDWYNWNHRNWGTKWDVAVSDKDEYPDTAITDEGEDFISYRFNTAWSPPIPAIAKLSEQYPDLELELDFEEETGWGGCYMFLEGEGSEVESYENKCRDCDSLNTMDYCENDCGEICDSCHYLGEAELDAVAECDKHKVFLDDEHIPEYRRVST